MGGGEQGISSVAGIALMIAVVAALAVVVAGMTLTMDRELAEPAPFVVTESELTVEPTNGTVEEPRLVLEHGGGDAVDPETLTLLVETERGRIERRSVDSTSKTWETGEQLEIGLDTGTVCDGSDRIETTLVRSTKSGQAYVLGRTSTPVSYGGFVVRNGAIVPGGPFTAEAKLLGVGFTDGDGNRIPVGVRIGVGETVYSPWPADVNDGNNPRNWTISDQPDGTPVAVGALRDPNDSTGIGPVTRWSDEDRGWVELLRDGDPVPGYEGARDQRDLEEHVEPYVDNDTLVLEDEQAIVAFELGNNRTGPAADYTDPVVLFTIESERSTAYATERADGRSRIVCPNERDEVSVPERAPERRAPAT